MPSWPSRVDRAVGAGIEHAVRRHHRRRLRRIGRRGAGRPAGLMGGRRPASLGRAMPSSSTSTARTRCPRSRRRSRPRAHVHLAGWYFWPDFRLVRAGASSLRELLAQTAGASRFACSPGPAPRCRCSGPTGRTSREALAGSCAARGSRAALRRARASDALPSREARDRRRRGGVRRRHRPDVARRRPLRPERPSGPRLGSAGTTRPPSCAARRSRTSRATSRCAGARSPASRSPSPRHPRPPARTRCRSSAQFRNASTSVCRAATFASSRPISGRSAVRAAHLPRESIPVVAGARRRARGEAPRPPSRRVPDRGRPPGPSQQRRRRHARPLAVLVDADGSRGQFLACSLYQVGARPAQQVYVHAKIAIVDDRWLTLGSANLNEHSLFNDTEMNIVVARRGARNLAAKPALGGAPGVRRRTTRGARPRSSTNAGGRGPRRSSRGSRPAGPSSHKLACCRTSPAGRDACSARSTASSWTADADTLTRCQTT